MFKYFFQFIYSLEYVMHIQKYSFWYVFGIAVKFPILSNQD